VAELPDDELKASPGVSHMLSMLSSGWSSRSPNDLSEMSLGVDTATQRALERPSGTKKAELNIVGVVL